MRVGLFVTCLVDLMRPSIGFAAHPAARSRRAPRSSCRRRRPAAASRPTTPAIARMRSALAAKLVAEFEDCDYLVAPSGSCSGMIRTHYADLFADDPAMTGARRRRSPRKRASSPISSSTMLKLDRVPGRFDGSGHLSRQLRRACARWASRRSRARCSRKVPGLALDEMAGVRNVLRLRRHVRDQVRRNLDAARRQQVRAHRGERRRRRRAGRPRLHAEHRGPAAPARRRQDAGAARRRSARGRASGLTRERRTDIGDRHASRSMHFKERAHVKLHDERLQRNLKKMQGKFVAKRRASLVELDDFEGTREAGKAIRNRALDNLDVWLEIFERNATARGATVLFAETPADINALVLEIAAKHACAEDHQVEVDGVRGVGARPRDRGRGLDGRRDRPRRIHPADQRLRAAVAHHRPGAAQVEGGGRRALPQDARHAAQDGHRGAVPRSARRAAPALSHRRHGHLRRQFLRRRDRARSCSSPTKATRR